MRASNARTTSTTKCFIVTRAAICSVRWVGVYIVWRAVLTLDSEYLRYAATAVVSFVALVAVRTHLTLMGDVRQENKHAEWLLKRERSTHANLMVRQDTRVDKEWSIKKAK